MILEVAGELAGGPGALWLDVLLNMVLKGSLVLGVALLLGRAFGDGPPDRRSRIWTAFFLVLILLPPATGVMSASGYRFQSIAPWFGHEPVITVVQTPHPPDGAIRPDHVDGVLDGAGGPGRRTTPVFAGESGGASRFGLRWSLAVSVWLVGATFLLCRLVARIGCGLLIARRSRVATDGIACREVRRLAPRFGLSGRVRVCFSPEAGIPFATGFGTARLVLPEALSGWSADRLRPVLLHELAHLARGDLLRMIVGDLACAIYWFHPLIWHSARRSVLDQELACDDVVCRHGVAATAYARVLLGFAIREPQCRIPHGATGFASRASLESRLEHILAKRGPLGPPSVRARRVATVAGGLALLSVASILTSDPVRSMDKSPVRFPRPAPSAVEAVAVTRDASSFSERTPDASAVHRAAAFGDAEALMRWLGSAPVLLDAKDCRGMTPLALAAWHDHPDLVERLLLMGADPDMRNDNGLTPLFCALDRGRRATAHLLIRHGADIRSPGYRSRTLLHMAARIGDRWSTDRLLEHGLDINATDIDGVTPLDLAVWGRHERLVDHLISLGARRSDVPDPYPHRHRLKQYALDVNGHVR